MCTATLEREMVNILNHLSQGDPLVSFLLSRTKEIVFKMFSQTGMVLHIYNPNIWETEAGGFL